MKMGCGKKIQQGNKGMALHKETKKTKRGKEPNVK